MATIPCRGSRRCRRVREVLMPPPKLPAKAFYAPTASATASTRSQLRYFKHLWPGAKTPTSAYAAVIAAFAKAMMSRAPLRIFGDGSQSRDFTFVDNAVHANLLAARCDTPLAGEIFNVGCGARVTLNELAKQMADLVGCRDLSPQYQARKRTRRHPAFLRRPGRDHGPS